MAKLTVPKFATETEEADWWDAHREEVSQDIAEAGRRGDLKILTKESLKERLSAKPISLRISEADLALAQKQAERKGLPYQTYIKSVLHETLEAREAQEAPAAMQGTR